jgi:hypothetical protein
MRSFQIIQPIEKSDYFGASIKPIMRFLTGKVKARTGEKITVTTSRATRVLIMQERQYKRYKNNLTFTYYGGEKNEPYEFKVPASGTWMVVVEKGTYLAPIDLTANITKTEAEPREPRKKVLANTEVVEDKKSKKEKKKKKGKKGSEEEQEVHQEMEAISNSEETSSEEISEEPKEE